MKFSKNSNASWTLARSSETGFANWLTPWLRACFVCFVLAAGTWFANAANPTPSNVTLAWDSSPDTAVTGYQIFFGAVSGQYTNNIAVGNVTSYTVSGLANGTTYYFAIAAYNASGVESPFSNEISYRVAFSELQLQTTATNQMILTVAGQSGHLYNIEATQDFKTWSVIGSVTPEASGSVEFIAGNAVSFPRRFYRLRDTTP